MSRIQSRLQAGKVIVITGARRTGKTVLLREIMKNLELPYLPEFDGFKI